MPEEQQESLGDLKTVARKQAEERMSSDYQDPRYLFLLRYDPAEDWAQVTAPVLALFAEFDDIVAASQNQPALEEALSKAGNDDVTIKTVPGVNHLFLEATSANPAEWTNLSQNLAPEAADVITNWILERIEAGSENMYRLMPFFGKFWEPLALMRDETSFQRNFALLVGCCNVALTVPVFSRPTIIRPQSLAQTFR